MFGQLADCQSVVIWKLHLDDVENTPMISIDTVCRAYETALDHIGQAWDSGTIWDEYIRLLKAQPTTHTWTIMLKITRLRSVYHRVIEIPLDNIGERWSALREFEDLYDAPNAEEIIASLRPAYHKARTTLHQLMKLTSLLGLSHINGLDLPKQPIFSDQERPMVSDGSRKIPSGSTTKNSCPVCVWFIAEPFFPCGITQKYGMYVYAQYSFQM